MLTRRVTEQNQFVPAALERSSAAPILSSGRRFRAVRVVSGLRSYATRRNQGDRIDDLSKSVSDGAQDGTRAARFTLRAHVTGRCRRGGDRRTDRGEHAAKRWRVGGIVPRRRRNRRRRSGDLRRQLRVGRLFEVGRIPKRRIDRVVDRRSGGRPADGEPDDAGRRDARGEHRRRRDDLVRTQRSGFRPLLRPFCRRLRLHAPLGPDPGEQGFTRPASSKLDSRSPHRVPR